MSVDKAMLLEERGSLPENHHIVRWLRPLLHQQLGRPDVFVPDHVTEAMLAPPKGKAKRRAGATPPVDGADVPPVMEPRVAFYFTVPSENWSVLCVRGSALSEHEVKDRFAILEMQRESARSEAAQMSVAVAVRALHRQVKRGLVPPDELHAQRQVFRDQVSAREAWGKFRVYRSHPTGTAALAVLFEQLGFAIIPILPAFSWRDVEFPHEDERYQVPMVHVQSRVPCPWSKRSLARRLYVHR